MKKLISLVIPAYNEEQVIPLLVKSLTTFINSQTSYSFEAIVIDNGSTDNTFNTLVKAQGKNKWLKIIQLAKNERTDGGLIAGLSYAKGDVAITLNADLQDPPSLIPSFITKWQEGYDIVYGVVGKREDVGRIRKIETFIFYKIIKLLTNNVVKENASDFRLLDKKVYQEITLMPEHDKFLRGLILWTGFKQTGITYDRKSRAAGKSKANFKTVLGVALDGILYYTNLPVYLPLIFSLAVFGVAVTLLALTRYSLALEALFFSITLLSLSIGLRYIKQILKEVQRRPQFIIKQKIGF